MKVKCVIQCFYKSRVYLPGQMVVVSDLNQIPPQHFSTLAGEPLVTKRITEGSKWITGPKKNMEWLVDPKTGKSLDGKTDGAADVEPVVTKAQIQEKLDKLDVKYDPKLNRAALVSLLEEAEQAAFSE